MIFKDKVKRKIAVVASAVALTAGAVAVTALPASADTQSNGTWHISYSSWDCFPAGNASGSTNPQGCQYGLDEYHNVGGGTGGLGSIEWGDTSKGQYGVWVESIAYDEASDGHSALVQTQVLEGSTVEQTASNNNTGGYGTIKVKDSFIVPSPNGVDDNTGVRIRACSGFLSDGTPWGCSSWAGPFHRY